MTSWLLFFLLLASCLFVSLLFLTSVAVAEITAEVPKEEAVIAEAPKEEAPDTLPVEKAVEESDLKEDASTKAAEAVNSSEIAPQPAQEEEEPEESEEVKSEEPTEESQLSEEEPEEADAVESKEEPEETD